MPKLPGVHKLLCVSYFRKHGPGASAWGCWKARDSQRLRPRTDPPDLPPRLFQKVPDLPKIPISLKQANFITGETQQGPLCTADFLCSSGHNRAVRNALPGPGWVPRLRTSQGPPNLGTTVHFTQKPSAQDDVSPA